MLTKDKAADIFGQLRKYSTADEIEAMIYGGKSALTRFANNTIHQNVAEEGYTISVRTASTRLFFVLCMTFNSFQPPWRSLV